MSWGLRPPGRSVFPTDARCRTKRSGRGAGATRTSLPASGLSTIARGAAARRHWVDIPARWRANPPHEENQTHSRRTIVTEPSTNALTFAAVAEKPLSDTELGLMN